MNQSSDNSRGPVRLALLAGPRTMQRIGPVVRHLTVGLIDEAVRPILVAPEGADLTGLPSPPVEVLTHEIARPGLLSGRRIDQLAEKLYEREVELLHGLDGDCRSLLYELAERRLIPYVQWVMNLEQARQAAQRRQMCECVLCASLRLRAEVLRHTRLDPAEVRVLRPGVHAAKDVARRQPGQALSIVCAGELEPYEPFAAVLEAFAALRARREDCMFFFIGAGRAERRLRRRSEQLGLAEPLTFVAPLPPSQMAGIFKAADVLVYPHSAGALEMEVLQAMAAGTCVLTGGPCVGDFVIDSETVLGYDGYNTADLQTKLDLLLSDPDAAAALAHSALEYLRAHHSPASMVAEAVEIYRRQALNGRTLKLR